MLGIVKVWTSLPASKQLVLAGVLGGLAVGLGGAIPPAVRCLRLPITEALKSF